MTLHEVKKTVILFFKILKIFNIYNQYIKNVTNKKTLFSKTINIIYEVDILNQYIEFLHDMKFKYIDTNQPMRFMYLFGPSLSFSWFASNEGYEYWDEKADKIRDYIFSNQNYFNQFY